MWSALGAGVGRRPELCRAKPFTAMQTGTISTSFEPMHLTIHADYGLRLLMYLGVRRESLSTVQEVADAYGVSAHHLVKVAQHLAQQGFVHAVRGRKGGLELAREPEEIRVGDVVRRMESDLALVECFDRDKDRCTLTPVCRLRPVLFEALEAFLAVLDEVTLADLLADPVPVADLLEIQPATARQRA